MIDLKEIGPTYYFAPPRVFEGLLTTRDDPHGRRGRDQAQDVPALHGPGAPRRPGADGRQAGRRAATGCCTRWATCWSTARCATRWAFRACAWPTRRARPSARTCSASTAPSASTSSSSTARPRPRCSSACSPTTRPGRHGGHPDQRRGDQGRRQRRDPGALARPAQGLLQEPRGHGRSADGRRLVPHQRRRLPRRPGPPEDHRPRQGRGPHRRRRQRRRDVRAQVRGEQAQVLPVHQGSRGLRRPAREGLRDDQHRLRRRGQLGRAAQPALCRLHRPGAKARGLRS